MCLRFSVSAPVPPLQCLRSSVSAPVPHLQCLCSNGMPLLSTRPVCKRIFFISVCDSFIYANQHPTDSYKLFSRNHSTAVMAPLGPSRTPVSVGVCYPIFFIIRMIFLYLHLFHLLQTAPVPGKSVIAFSSYLRVIQFFMQICVLQTHTNFFPGTTPQLSWPPLGPSRTPVSVIP